ncbi:MAG: translation initiation factor IF-2 [Candidatus Nomurabacteria bacterium]|nr:MAG: translation initiation factor IF-2 [Candidatus Nomurabacteria bacterium]
MDTATSPAPASEEKNITLPETVVIKDLAEKLEVPVTRVIAELMKNGIMSGQNERIDFDTASIIAAEFNVSTEKEAQESNAQDLSALENANKEEASKLKVRPPVVVVMGHVDHGKTLLLDKIRETNVAEKEAGGITQSIGAYQVIDKERAITFIDTPGHEAFSAMRSRGARVADVAILVVAADDGVKPQTLEALKIIKASNLPFVVAINKIDKPEANLERVKQGLAEQEVQAEDWGGNVVMAPVSAKTGQGIPELLDMVLLVADLQKDRLRANPDRLAIGTIIESHIDPGEGPVATVLVQSGTLHRGDQVTIGNVYGKIKALKDYRGKSLSEAAPATPAKIIGLKGAPAVGDILQAVTDLSDVKKRVKSYQLKNQAPAQVSASHTLVESEGTHAATIIPVVVKADTLGSLEAIVGALEKLQNEEVAVRVIHKGLGNISEADVLAAETSKAKLYGFNVDATPSAEAVAKGKDIAIEHYSIIYDLVAAVRIEAESQLSQEVIVTEIGAMKVLAIFRTERKAMIVGGEVTKGKAVPDVLIRVKRNDESIGTGTAKQVKIEKRVVNEVSVGGQCGVRYEGEPIVAEGDTLEFYTEETRKKTLGA